MKLIAIDRQQAYAGAAQTADAGPAAWHAGPALFAVPVLPVTLLGLELLCDRPAFDLRAATRLLREDPGAVLQLFASVAEEFPDAADRPTRLDSCLAALPRERLLPSLTKVCGGHRLPARFANHAAAVARSAETVAGALGLPVEPARIVGLLHEVGHLPAMLGWGGWPAHPAMCSDRLATAHGLPASLGQALNEVHRGERASLWTSVIAAAHELLPRPA